MKFNTAIASLMTLLNEIYEVGSITKGELKTFVKLLDPFAPHVSEEVWAELGGDGLLAVAQWPEFDEAKTVDATIEVPVQICGKLRATITIAKDSTAEEAIAEAAPQEEAPVVVEETVSQKSTSKNRVGAMFDFLTFSDV
jgi:leucyl-tRNA synthetase